LTASQLTIGTNSIGTPHETACAGETSMDNSSGLEPSIAVNATAPDVVGPNSGTGSAKGAFIADASVPYLDIGILDEPIVCRVEAGLIVEMSGGPQAKRLRDHLESFDDPACFNVAELGVGLNPQARLTGEMLEDEGVVGTIHIGIGTSHTLGGDIVAPTHYDLLMWEPTIEVDGRVVQRDQEIFG